MDHAVAARLFGKVLHLFAEAGRRFIAQGMTTHVAAVTYYLVFSVFPFSIFLLAALSFIGADPLFDWIRHHSQAIFLDATIRQINTVLDQLQHRRVGLLSFSAVASLWASSSAIRALMRALNAVHQVTEDRSIWRRYPVSVLVTAVIGSCMAVVIGLTLIAQPALEGLISQFDLPRISEWLRWPLIGAILWFAVVFIYRICPCATTSSRAISVGALFAALAQLLLSALFDFYVRRMSTIGVLYGAPGTLLVLLLYAFMTSAVILFGAELNAVTESELRRPGRASVS